MRPSQDGWIDSYWMDGWKMKRFDEAWIKREVEQDQDPTTSAVSATLLRAEPVFPFNIKMSIALSYLFLSLSLSLSRIQTR